MTRGTSWSGTRAAAPYIAPTARAEARPSPRRSYPATYLATQFACVNPFLRVLLAVGFVLNLTANANFSVSSRDMEIMNLSPADTSGQLWTTGKRDVTGGGK